MMATEEHEVGVQEYMEDEDVVEEQESSELSTSPKGVVDATSLLYNLSSRKAAAVACNKTNNNKKENEGSYLSLSEFIDELPRAIEERKVNNIPPGASNDPICHLFRYVWLPWVSFSFLQRTNYPSIEDLD